MLVEHVEYYDKLVELEGLVETNLHTYLADLNRGCVLAEHSMFADRNSALAVRG